MEWGYLRELRGVWELRDASHNTAEIGGQVADGRGAECALYDVQCVDGIGGGYFFELGAYSVVDLSGFKLCLLMLSVVSAVL